METKVTKVKTGPMDHKATQALLAQKAPTADLVLTDTKGEQDPKASPDHSE